MQKPLPINERLEVLVLASCFQSFDAANECLTKLDSSDFFNPKHQILFKAFQLIVQEDRAIETFPILHFLDQHKLTKELPKEYVFVVESTGWSGMPYEEFIEQLKKVTFLRKSVYAAQELIVSACKDDAEPEKILFSHQEKLIQCQGLTSSTSYSARDLMEKFSKQGSFMKDLEWRIKRFSEGLPTFEGVSTGFSKLDKCIGAFQNSCIYYIGARTSMGKTTFIINLFRNMMFKYKIGFFSLEMPADKIMAKLVCMHIGVKYARYEEGNLSSEEWERFASVYPSMCNIPFYPDDQGGLSIEKLCARARRWKFAYNIDVLFIDHLSQISTQNKHPNMHSKISEISKALQALAKDLKIPVVCLCQLNREVTGRANNRPQLSDFRESGSIEEDADACILLHRPEYYDKNDSPGQIHVIVAKNRILGDVRTIPFTCNYAESDRYFEAIPVESMLPVQEGFEQFLPKSYKEN